MYKYRWDKGRAETYGATNYLPFKDKLLYIAVSNRRVKSSQKKVNKKPTKLTYWYGKEDILENLNTLVAINQVDLKQPRGGNYQVNLKMRKSLLSAIPLDWRTIVRGPNPKEKK